MINNALLLINVINIINIKAIILHNFKIKFKFMIENF